MGKQNGKRYHFLYRTTNLIDNKYYVGIHSTYNLNDGYLGSGKRLKRAIKKYGIENFKFEILEFFENREDVLKREEEIVNEQLINDPLCMNLQPGGGGGFSSEEHKRKCIEAGKKATSEKWKDETYRRKKIEAIRKGKYKRIEAGNYVMPNWNGRKHREETKIKIGKANSEKKGEKNSQFGTCWITNGFESKKIKKDELALFIENGWKKGRVCHFNDTALERMSNGSKNAKKKSHDRNRKM